jgi:hypothetical protein
MATFPAPYLEPLPFQILPEEGTRLTEAALLRLLHNLLKPLNAITYFYMEVNRELYEETDEMIVLEIIHRVQDQAVFLLDAWHEHQAADEADGDAGEDDAAAAEVSARLPSRPRGRRRPPAPED